jgi:hypothetical protein
LEAIDVLLGEFERARGASPHDDLSGGLRKDEIRAISTRVSAAITRYSAAGSAYRQEAERTDQEITRIGMWEGVRLQGLVGVLSGLRADIASGYLSGVEELVHADVFSDFLEMAVELLRKEYKDPAAVVAGSVLEEHLRKLATKAGIPIEDERGAPVKSDRLNASLAAAGVYNKLEQKSITAWLDLRNQAAHGRYAEYDARQVRALIESVRDFLLRTPA